MPFGKCPICGAMYHLQVTDHAQWYKDRGLKFGDLLMEKCYGCWRELKIGDRIKVILPPSDNLGVAAGDVGHVIDVLTTEDGKKIYQIESGDPPEPPHWNTMFEREAITYANRGKQPVRPIRTILLKYKITLHFPEPGVVYCAMDGKMRTEINMCDLYDQYADWKLTAEQLAEEIQRRLVN